MGLNSTKKGQKQSPHYSQYSHSDQDNIRIWPQGSISSPWEIRIAALELPRFGSIWFILVLFVVIRKEIRGLCTFYVESARYYAYVYLAPVDSDTTVHGELYGRLSVVQGRPSLSSIGSYARLAKVYS
jgi:hypothetical protein